MALALTSVHCYGVEADEVITKKFQQKMVLVGTAAASDVTYDFGALVGGSLGTYWTAVSGTDPGTTALTAIQQISALATEWLNIEGTIVNAKAQVAVDAASSFVVTQANKTPKVALHAGEGVTAYTVVITWDLPPGVSPVQVYKSA